MVKAAMAAAGVGKPKRSHAHGHGHSHGKGKSSGGGGGGNNSKSNSNANANANEKATVKGASTASTPAERDKEALYRLSIYQELISTEQQYVGGGGGGGGNGGVSVSLVVCVCVCVLSCYSVVLSTTTKRISVSHTRRVVLQLA